MADAWAPTTILFEIESYATNSLTVQVETDQGIGYLKCLTDKTDPTDLVCDLIGSRLAKLFGLTVPDFHLVPVAVDSPITLSGSAKVLPGAGFISRKVTGEPLANNVAGLMCLANPQDLARLVVFDTWTVNCDRYRPASHPNGGRANRGNLLLSRDGAPAGTFVLTLIDHGCCFRCQYDLTRPRLQTAATDDTLYGCFPEFRGLVLKEDALRAGDELQSLMRDAISGALDDVPTEWGFTGTIRDALLDMLTQRQRRVRQIVDRRFPAADMFDSEDATGGTP